MDLFPLYATEDIDLILFWEAFRASDGSTRKGHHVIPGMRLSSQSWIYVPAIADPAFVSRVTNSLYMETKRERISLISSLNRNKQSEQSPMKILFSSPDKHAHDFNLAG